MGSEIERERERGARNSMLPSPSRGLRLCRLATTEATPSGRRRGRDQTRETEGVGRRAREAERDKHNCRLAEMDLHVPWAFVGCTARWKIPWGNGDVIRRIEVKWHFQDHHVQSSHHKLS